MTWVLCVARGKTSPTHKVRHDGTPTDQRVVSLSRVGIRLFRFGIGSCHVALPTTSSSWLSYPSIRWESGVDSSMYPLEPKPGPATHVCPQPDDPWQGATFGGAPYLGATFCTRRMRMTGDVPGIHHERPCGIAHPCARLCQTGLPHPFARGQPWVDSHFDTLLADYCKGHLSATFRSHPLSADYLLILCPSRLPGHAPRSIRSIVCAFHTLVCRYGTLFS